MNANCINIIGSFLCQCKFGYRGDGVNCTDVNECTEQNHNCVHNSECHNIPGSFSCQCENGYSGLICSDINECDNNPCKAHSTCRNQIGSFKCDCNDGYDFNQGSCKNIDECSDNVHICDKEATCTDTNGSYTCSCKSGFFGPG